MDKIFIGAALLAMAGYVYYSYNKRLKNFEDWYLSHVETLDGVLNFDAIVSFFKTLNMNQNENIPFVVREGSREFTKYSGGRAFPKHKEGYVSIFVGVFNEHKQEITNYKVIYAKGMDARTKEVFGDEHLVVLK